MFDITKGIFNHERFVFSFVTLAFCHVNAKNIPGKVAINNTFFPKTTVDIIMEPQDWRIRMKKKQLGTIR